MGQTPSVRNAGVWGSAQAVHLAQSLHSPLRYLINTVALARCAEALTSGELFQQFAHAGDKPLRTVHASLRVTPTGLKPQC